MNTVARYTYFRVVQRGESQRVQGPFCSLCHRKLAALGHPCPCRSKAA